MLAKRVQLGLWLDECRDVVETEACKGRVFFLARETLSPKRDDRGSSFTRRLIQRRKPLPYWYVPMTLAVRYWYVGTHKKSCTNSSSQSL